jgi:uncharacterized protein YidB (DUF937 family)
MGLFDNVLKSVTGKAGEGSQSALATATMTMLCSHIGGISGLAQQFSAHGLGSIISSWIGTGQNMPISGEQLQNVLSSEQIERVASQAGVSPEAAISGLARILPLVVDHLTPDGEIPQGDLMSKCTELLKQRLAS